MNIAYSTISFFLGISIGSFLNVVIDRVPREETFLTGRSHCEFCKHTLYWYDLIPLLSFIFLEGKCRYCKKMIGLKYPLVELTTGVLFVILLSPLSAQLANESTVTLFLSVIFSLLIFCSFIVIFYTDLWSGIIPDIVLFPIIGITVLYLLFQNPSQFLLHIISGFVACAFFLALFLVTKGKGMGFGDVKLALFLGILLGWPGTFLAIYIAFLTGAIAALILILWGKKQFFGSTIPFGPFLIIGATISWFWEPMLWQKILTLL